MRLRFSDEQTNHGYHDYHADDHDYNDDDHDDDHGDDHDDQYEDYKHRCDDNNCDDLNKIVEDVENFGRSDMHVRCKGGFHTFHMSPKISHVSHESKKFRSSVRQGVQSL